MTLKLAAIALLSLTAAVGLPACANSRDAAVEPSTETAQMDHGGMGQMDSDGMMQMDLGPADESFDLRFVDAMIMHHRGAMVVAEGAQQTSTRPESQTLDSDIIAASKPKLPRCRHGGKLGTPMPWQTRSCMTLRWAT